MKRIYLSSTVLLISIFIANMSFALTFEEVPVGTTDPTIDGVSFWAGDPGASNDAIVEDFWSPGDQYLLSGYDDGTGSSPGLYDTFIGVSSGTLLGTVTLDVLSELVLPGGTTLVLQGRLGGLDVESISLAVTDSLYHNLSLTFSSGADTLYLYDDLNEFGFGEEFHINDFTSTAYTQPPSGVPEPSTFMLLASGLAGSWYLRKKILNLKQ